MFQVSVETEVNRAVGLVFTAPLLPSHSLHPRLNETCQSGFSLDYTIEKTL